MSEREIIIGFGTLFEVAEDEKGVAVVISTGKGGLFEVAQVRETEEGKKRLLLSGTAGRNKVRRVIGQMSFDEVIKAAEEGAKHAGIGELPQDMRDLLEKYSKEEPRVLK